MIGILGWTGLVGQTLFHQLVAKGAEPRALGLALYNSKNVQDMRNTSFTTLYICCMPAVKWWANAHPTEDRRTLDTVLEVLATVQATQVILLSTVDVLDGQGHEESCMWAQHAYGLHRRALEVWVQHRWPTTSYILRLPALFGRGLKKNALYDLLVRNQVDKIYLDSTFQWYNLRRLLQDCETAVRHGFRIQHLVSAPLRMRDVVERWFPQLLPECAVTAATHYNLTTTHGACTDGQYAYTKESVLRDMGAWIAWDNWRRARNIAASNIGFTMSPDVEACLRHLGLTCLEIAPGKGTNYGGFTPVSVQSVLYGTSIRNIFWESGAFLEHMRRLLEVVAPKGVRTIVFGCPRQRDRGTAHVAEVQALFRQLGDLAAQHGITVCVEHNARAYGCAWLTTIEETLRFVQDLQHPNIRLSLDSGNAAMEGGLQGLVESSVPWIGHVQLSAAHLGSHMNAKELGVAKKMVHFLMTNRYQGTISWEARETDFVESCRGLRQFVDVLEDAFNQDAVNSCA